MPRARSGVPRKKRRKRILRQVKGYRGARSKLLRTAKGARLCAEQFATIHRRRKKRDFRRLWITRLTAACRERGMSYGRFIQGLKKAGVEIDRKVLSDMAIRDEGAFTKIVETARSHLSAG